jgi:iron(III) transport system permease protein
MTSRSSHGARQVLLGWALLAAAAYALLPWYLPQNLSLLSALPQVFGGAETASGLMQAMAHGRPWLWATPVALLLVGMALAQPAGPRQGWWLVAGSAVGLAVLLGAGFGIGATGWSFAFLENWFGALKQGQFGIGLGGAGVLLCWLMLLGAGLARLGYFRGDFFVAGAVVLCSALLLLFVALPVGKSLAGAFFSEDGSFSPLALAERLGNERVWGLQCVVGGVRCGVAWNTLFLALLTAAGTTVMGTLIALYAERGNRRLQRPLNVLALLPIITPRAHPAVRPRRPGQPVSGVGLWHTTHTLVLWLVRCLAGADVCLHADCVHDHARRCARHQPEHGRSGANPARQPHEDLRHGDPALDEAGPGQRLPGRLH